MFYRIQIRGSLDESWLEWLGSLAISAARADDGSWITTLVVDATDSSALFGVLDRIRDLNLDLLSVGPIDQPES